MQRVLVNRRSANSMNLTNSSNNAFSLSCACPCALKYPVAYSEAMGMFGECREAWTDHTLAINHSGVRREDDLPRSLPKLPCSSGRSRPPPESQLQEENREGGRLRSLLRIRHRPYVVLPPLSYAANEPVAKLPAAKCCPPLAFRGLRLSVRVCFRAVWTERSRLCPVGAGGCDC